MDVCRYLILYRFLAFTVFRAADCFEASIVGGKDVRKPQPWMVSIQMNRMHVCGGILIQEQWVLTAAHCLREPVSSVTVLLGSLSLSKGSQRVGILGYESPKTFDATTKQDDIMLIKLSKKVKAKAKKIPKKEHDVPPGTKCVVTGWGSANAEVLKASDKLQMLEVTVMDRDLCNRFYNRDPEITRDMLCAGTKREKRGICWVCLHCGLLRKSSFDLHEGKPPCVVFQGDSGGPLECKKNIVGLVSGSKECGDPKKPAVYTFLSERHIRWIKNILKKQFNSTSS
ncbi:granzyme K-like isoform X1 [Puntigrus tetrazona]|uniref:granzyme K-like isoform X1 n=1 Tax=Puntigrus tetrazona TaxID=1606681 RepID=UPI001C8AA5C0|nr:granzyme K-like isoform X1 [Puntigrus tetrazona]